jgi:hypothetical protein
MDLIVAIGALVLVGLLIVGLFHGPSHRDSHAHARPARRTPPVSEHAGAEPSAPTPPLNLPPSAALSAVPNEPPAYVLPPRQRRHLGRRPVTGPRGRRS